MCWLSPLEKGVRTLNMYVLFEHRYPWQFIYIGYDTKDFLKILIE